MTTNRESLTSPTFDLAKLIVILAALGIPTSAVLSSLSVASGNLDQDYHERVMIAGFNSYPWWMDHFFAFEDIDRGMQVHINGAYGSVGGVSYDPSGERIFFIRWEENESGVTVGSNIWSVNRTGEDLQQQSFFHNNLIFAYHFSSVHPDELVIVTYRPPEDEIFGYQVSFINQHSGEEVAPPLPLDGIYNTDPRFGMLTKPESPVSGNMFIQNSAYVPELPQIFTVFDHHHAEQLISPPGEQTRTLAWSPFDNRLLHTTELETGGVMLRIYDIDLTSEDLPILLQLETKLRDDVFSGSAAWDITNPNQVVVLTEIDSESANWVSLSLDTLEYSEVDQQTATDWYQSSLRPNRNVWPASNIE